MYTARDINNSEKYNVEFASATHMARLQKTTLSL